ncbi:Lrp/AsnC family transcriptional regulator [Leptolyngbya sp. NK1-12]|uniref:Lrp/AsnC family transcriptional regulator n=1 Tax=Leptolyngbya sp. NK1-12 TaxID=2547451 RepID=A0AA96WLI5_9CYAN|nr:Lrp/AsnC family transcriptional regulator [Leptolyngbya sp. NK1-12]WNZ27718.1 Lrp/AsnC family transcriptional regulator [Leptolyngbya sp. NK1-12]
MTYETKVDLDEIDWQLLDALQEDARLSYTELGKQVGLTRPAVAERVRRLEERGVITGYRAEVDPVKLGLPILAFVRIGAIGDVFASVAKVVVEIPEVLECHRGTGGECFILKVRVASLPHLEAVIDRLTKFGQVTTSIVLSSVLTQRPISHR